MLAEDIPIDVRPTDIEAFRGLKADTKVTQPKMCVWVRAKGYIGWCLSTKSNSQLYVGFWRCEFVTARLI